MRINNFLLIGPIYSRINERPIEETNKNKNKSKLSTYIFIRVTLFDCCSAIQSNMEYGQWEYEQWIQIHVLQCLMLTHWFSFHTQIYVRTNSHCMASGTFICSFRYHYQYMQLCPFQNEATECRNGREVEYHLMKLWMEFRYAYSLFT